jgi:hypothetical protein
VSSAGPTPLLVATRSSVRFTSVEKSVWLLGLLSLGFSFYATSVGFQNSLYDFHGFRQTQTAISAELMMRGGSFLRYQTPVFGPPWPLPFEFPLYQGLVAGVSKALSTPLDQTGRFISILFYYLCFFPLASILSRIGFGGADAIPPLALFAVSPLYVFGSRLFMIESTALLLSLLFADQMFRLVLGQRRWPLRHIAGAAAFGVLAGMVKITTFAAFFVLGVCLAAWGLWRARKNGELGLGHIIGALCCLGLPVAMTGWWTHFADGVRAQNPIGIYLITKALHSWTFGTIAQRLHPRLYLQLLDAANNHIGNIWVAFVILGTHIWLHRRWNWVAMACLTLYTGTILLFFNLYVVHEYYPYANAVFLVVATGALIASVLKMPGKRAWVGVVMLTIAIAGCCFRYFTHYYPVQVRNAPGRPNAAAIVDRTTGSESVILITGLEWSPEFPYQSHRRAIMDAFYPKTASWGITPVEQAIANQGPKNVSALVACDQARRGPRLAIFLRDLNFKDATNLHADDCDIYEWRVGNI